MKHQEQTGFPLSPQQKHLWLLHQSANGAPWRAQCAISIEGTVSLDALEKSLRRIIERHEILRTSFHRQPGVKIPFQVIADTSSARWEHVDLSGCESSEQQTRIDELFRAEGDRSFDFENNSPLRLLLAKLSPGKHLLIVTLPSICADSKTLRNLVFELGQFYRDGVLDQSLLQEPMQYADFSQWQNELLAADDEETPSAKAFWQEQYLSSPPAVLPFEGDKEGQNESRSIEPDIAVFATKHSIPDDGTSPYAFLLACWQTLLWRLTGQPDFVVDAVFDGRDYEELTSGFGPYAKSLPLKCSFENDPRFREFVEQVQQSIESAREWQAYLNPQPNTGSSRNRSGIAFEVDERELNQHVGGVAFSVARQYTCIDRFRVKLCCVRSEDSFRAEFHYDAALFQSQAIERIAGHFATLVESARTNPAARVSELAILGEAERKRLITEFNETKSSYPAERCIHELFEEQVEKTPTATALVCEERRLSYEELNARANQLARFLLRRGVRPDVKVGLCADRSLDMIVGLLGILKAGAAYVPLSPEHPKPRLLAQLTDIQASVLVTQEKLLPQLPDFDGEVVCLDRDCASFESEQTTNPKLNTSPQHLAYVIYTSGSTGVPKGVAVTHESLVNYTDYICKKLKLDQLPAGQALQFASVSTITADLGNTCVFPSLVSGGCLHILNYETATDRARFADYFSRHPIDVLKIVPSHLSSLLDQNAKSNLLPKRYLFLGGEALSWELVERIQAINPDCEVINHYGPTETTVGSLTFTLGRNGALAKTASSVPIGRPITNTEVFILDQHLNPVPLGVSGQLYIGGAGLAQNYLNKPEQTAERFIPSPFSTNGAMRLYKTGDRARYLVDGNIEFLGRGDNQVKIRGYRVELGEVEATLGRHQAVRKVVVLAREVDEGNKQLVAYVVPAIDEAATSNDLRSFLREIVPEYMIPTTFVFLQDLPLTRNGKVDRAALPAPDFSRPELQKTFVAPGTPSEELVAGIWAELLKLNRVGAHDNFFELGGHSLLATQVISRLRETFQVELPLSSLFETPTVCDLAQRIETARFASPDLIGKPILPTPRGPRPPLSYAQQRLWLLDQLEPGSYAYNVTRVVRARGPLNYEALKKTLDTLAARHETLRTTFDATDGMPFQVIAEKGVVPVRSIDLAELAPITREQEAERLITGEAQQPFDLSRGPLTRVTVIRLETDRHILIINNHHIISDGWSAGILFEELALLYRAFSLDQSPQLPPLPVQYADYALWQREWLEGNVLEREIDYWKQQLDGAPALLELPADRPRPAVQTHRGARERIKLSADLAQAVKSLSRREGVTLFMTFLATFQLLLSRHSGQDDIVVGSPIAGRTRAEIERLIGFFLNTLVLRTQLSGELTFRDLLRRVRDVALEAYAHQHLPFERLIEELQPARDLSHTPLFQVFLNVLNFSPIEIDLPGLTIEHLKTPDIGSKFDLTLYVVEQKNGMTLELLYNSDLFESDRMAEMLQQLQFLLAQIVDRPDEKISSFSLVTPAAKQLLPDPKQAIPATSRPPVHVLFSEQARRDPNKLAVLDPNESWTYSELDYRSNQLANYLIASGIRVGDRVAIYAHRSAALVWAVVGVLKAGAAFVILDPAYPVSRLISCLQMAQPCGWIQITAAGPLPNRLDQFLETLSCCSRVELTAGESAETLLSQYPGDDPLVKVNADDLAYVAFTSGSTGTPKGILGRHGPLTLFTPWAQQMFGLSETDRISMLSGLAHDPLHRDIFTPLQLGATICIPDPEDLGVPLQLVEWFNERKITVANLTPAMAQLLCETTWTTTPSQIASLRYAFLVGDVLTKHDAGRLKVLAPSLTCVNLYGSTETQRAVGYFVVPPVPAYLAASSGGRPLDKEVLPLGKGIQEVQLLLLNSAQQMSGIGEVGEIHFRSPHLAKGYLGDHVLTNERFLPNPFTQTPGDRLYRTGDLGRYLPDGNVEFLQRADRQVKIRGFRIELGEVEAALTEHPDVRQGVVLLREKTATEKHLVAYVVLVQGSAATIAELRRTLKDKLPDYMLPSDFVILEALPLTPNGKLDQAALPAPDPSRRHVDEGFVAPQTATEAKLASIWEAVLKVERVGINDNFFELGGHSLLATQVVGRIRNTLQIEMPLRALFEAPTIKGLAEKLQTIRASSDSDGLWTISRVSRDRELPLSFAQQRLWFLNELEGESAFYNIPWAVRLQGELNEHALREALATIIERHEVLRTRFTMVDEEPYQIVSESTDLAFSVTDLSELPDTMVETEARRLGTAEARQRFDLQTGPLLRARLLRLRTDDHVLCVTTHHIVSDGWSIGIFVTELTELYESHLTGRAPRLRALPVQYADYAVWQRQWLAGEVLEQQLSYWKERLRGVPAVLELPKDRARPAVQTFHGASRTTQLSAELTQALNELSQQQGVTLFMTLLAAFQVLLWRYSAQEDIVVGSPMAGRQQEEVEGLIGFFVNTLVLRTDLSGNPSFRELVERVREVALGAYANQELPFEKLVDELQPERSLSYGPLFQVMFVLQNAPRAEFKLSGLTLTRMGAETKTSKFDLTLFATEHAGNLKLALEYNTDLFDAARIERMLEHLRVLLECAVRKPETRIGELEILTTAEREQLLLDWNQTAAEVDAKRIHELFEEQVKRTPNATAVIFEKEQLTYRELNRRANQLAHYLKKRGVGPDVLVGVCVERSLEMVVGLLGILKAGGAYVPLDPAYPAERLRFMMEDASARLLLTQQRLLQLLPESSAEVVSLDSDWAEVSKESDENLWANPATENLAYVIYTSGSTGKPKGVQISHVALVNFLTAMRERPGLAAEDVLLSVTTLSFDIAALEIYLPLIVGARLVIASKEVTVDGGELLQLLNRSGATVMQATPATWQLLIEAGWKGKESLTIFCGGEALSRDLADRLITRSNVLWNLYGPTETTVWSAAHQFNSRNGEITIGRPIRNTQIYILDAELQPMPVGVPGELYIGGAGLARGYLNRPELTANAFIPDPFSAEGGARLYRTGDLAQYLDDGNIQYLGRIDNQLKLRGFRIELGEIEAVIKKHPQVSETIVLAREDESGDSRLVAYVVPEKPGVNRSELRDYLRKKLPDYMLPAAIVELDEFPLTPNGKVDRRALPTPQLLRSDLKTAFQAPRTPTEEGVAGIWSEILRVAPIGVHDNFFHLGGHSLLAVRVISRIRVAFGAELSLRSFFESPTVAGCADRIDEAIRDARQLQQPPLVRTSRQGDLPLSFAQQRLWFLNQLETESAFYNVPIARRLRGALDIEALRKALESLMLRHEALRTNFTAIDGKPVQIIKEQPGVAFSDIDLRHAQNVEVEIERVSSHEAAQPFNLSSDPPLRVKLLRVGEDDAVLLITLHHIVSDGWSIEVLMRELAAFYEAYSVGTAAQLPELPIQYADYSVWQREWLESDHLKDQLAYWKKQLHGIPSVFELPKDRPRPPVQSYRGHVRSVEVPTVLAQQLNEFSRQEGVTLFTTLLAALQTLMWRYTGQHDVVVGTPVANRNQREVEGLIGFFANTLVLRSDLSGTPTFRELLGRVREVVLNALANQDLPFERLVDELQPERSLSRTPLFQVNFTLQNVRQPVGLNGLRMERVSFEQTTSKFDLIMTVVERPNNLGVTVEYNTDLFDDARMERLLGNYQTLLAGIVANPSVKISQLPILTEWEREQLLFGWNETTTSYGETKCIHELFSEQVERVPGATAVVFGERQLSYVELDQRANQLARYLKKRGVGAESFVGICVNRSPEMLIGLLGVLKAGAAYLPLDPNHPTDLMSYMLSDAQVSVLLAEESLRSKLPERSAQLICLDSDWNEIQKESGAAVQNSAHGNNLAYVIYTSGSTGKPRGVMVTHGGLANYLNWSRNAYSVSEGAGTLVHSPLGFDLTVTSLLLPLVAGQRVTLLREDDGIEELALALSTGVDHTLVKLTPSHLEGLSHLLPRNQSWKTRALVVGGEALFGERISFWRTAAPDTRIFNEYGPTETVVGCCVHEVTGDQKSGSVPIGRPIANTKLYVLDSQWELLPVGVPGELYIGGVGVARGYVNKAELTADRFIPDPFSDRPGQRLYRTGDVVRYLADGNLEYIGRTDHQVKLRGYRIELGEIEALLNSHPQVREAVVLAREDEPGNKRLVGYIVAQLDGLGSEQKSEFETAQVSDWQEVFNESYGNAQPAPDPKFNIVGWNSSYTGDPIPAYEMREWVERTVERILALEPKRVLEIGCGSGLLLFRIAPRCEKYHGTDLSQAALDYLKKHLAAAGSEFANVTLSRQQGDDLADMEAGRFDTIVLNSVVQYFPSEAYLLNLLRDLVRALKPGGSIFLGDVRSLPLLRAFSTSIQLHNAPDEMTLNELRLRIEKQIAQEKELVIDPAFFIHLRRQIPEIRSVDVELKRANHPNELSKFRYDVTLRVGTKALPQVRSEVLHWQADRLDLDVLKRLLANQQPESLIIKEVPNGLLAPEFKAMAFLDAEVEPQTVRELRKALQASDRNSGVNPEDIWSFDRELPYKVQLRASGAQAADSFDVMLRRKDARCAEVLPQVEIAEAEQTFSYTNNPLRAKVEQSLLPGLRQLLKEKLPEHMALSDFVFLPELPLTYNGKIDRTALPAPDKSRSQSEPFEAPRTHIESQLAQIWSEILRRREVGRNDNFFQLGGHSLLATQVISRVRERFRIQFPLRRMFEFPTIAEMAVAVGQAQQEGKEQPQLQMRSKGRDRSTLLKNIDNLTAEQIDSLLSEILGK